MSRRFEGRPKDLFDAMATGLGLDQIKEAHDQLRAQRRADDRTAKGAQDAVSGILDDLRASEDERALTCATALGETPWNLDTVASVLSGTRDEEGDQPLGILRELTALKAPNDTAIDDTCQQLANAQERLNAIAGSDAARADRLLRALQEALSVHEGDGEQPCPVCGKGTLDAAWAAESHERMATLRREANEARAAHEARTNALDAARALCAAPPNIVSQAGQVGLDASGVVDAWGALAAAPEGDVALPELAKRLRERGAALQVAVETLRQAAEAELERRHSLWQPLRQALDTCLPLARDAQQAETRRGALKEAEQWVNNTREDVRIERFRPVSKRAQDFWETMRQNSSVSLDSVTLAGVGNKLRLEMAVSVDGTGSAALGVMSQGELNTLSLSLFLARATLDESPFRFLVIDDPVQAMDPTKVDGLARVLGEVAQTRQVIVFTHDMRLNHSVRQMEIPATIFRVARDANSKVAVKKDSGPVWQNVLAALTVLNSENVPLEIKERVVPVFCRQALEAACLEAVWQRRTATNADPERTEGDINTAKTLYDKLALLLFDDPNNSGRALDEVRSRFGEEAYAVVKDCNSGAHGGALTLDLTDLTKETRKLADKLRKAK